MQSPGRCRDPISVFRVKRYGKCDEFNVRKLHALTRVWCRACGVWLDTGDAPNLLRIPRMQVSPGCRRYPAAPTSSHFFSVRLSCRSCRAGRLGTSPFLQGEKPRSGEKCSAGAPECEAPGTAAIAGPVSSASKMEGSSLSSDQVS
jgi:hypothetical protein